MDATATQIIYHIGEGARVTPWKADRAIVQLDPLVGGRLLSAGFVQHCVDQLNRRGCARVLTPPLSPLEQMGFLASGFEVEQRLVVLSLGAAELRGGTRRPRQPIAVRTARRSQVRDLVGVDAAAFGPRWSLDRGGLARARGATARCRVRAAALRGAACVGYAVAGWSRPSGFIQRLAVRPENQGEGIGGALLGDAVFWLMRLGAATVTVNTQADNTRALNLYESFGFRRQRLGLCVLVSCLPG